jgi:hypothetical protein
MLYDAYEEGPYTGKIVLDYLVYREKQKENPASTHTAYPRGRPPYTFSLTRHRGIPLHLVLLDAAIATTFLAVVVIVTVVVIVAVSLVVAVVIIAGVVRAGRGRRNSGGCMASSSDSRGRGRRARQRGNTEHAEALGELAGRLPQEKVRLVRVAVVNLL